MTEVRAGGAIAVTRRRPTVLVVGQGRVPTGFGRISDGILRALATEFEVVQLAPNHRRDVVSAPWPAFGNPRLGDAHGRERLVELATRLRPDVVLVIGDLWFAEILADRIATAELQTVRIAYCPVDGDIMEGFEPAGLAAFHRLVAYTEFGRAQLVASLANLGPPVDVVPHAIDTHHFHPMPVVRRRATDFCVLNANKHQPRKRIDLTLRGFAEFARDKPASVRLFLHSPAEFAGSNLDVLVRELGVADRVQFSCTGDTPRFYGNRQLNRLYNSCAVGINTSAGEGWGLVAFEHGTTGAPQIVPGHGACGELWQGSALLLPPRRCHEQFALGMRWHFTDPEDVAQALEYLYVNAEARMELGKAARSRTLDPALSWTAVGNQWRALIRRALLG